jgi:hypothetical protein
LAIEVDRTGEGVPTRLGHDIAHDTLAPAVLGGDSGGHQLLFLDDFVVEVHPGFLGGHVVDVHPIDVVVVVATASLGIGGSDSLGRPVLVVHAALSGGSFGHVGPLGGQRSPRPNCR